MLAPMRWKSAAGASPGRSRITFRYFRRRVVHPSSSDSPSARPNSPRISRRELVEQMEERARMASHEGATQAERLAAGVGGDALSRASALVLVRLVADEQVEEAPQVVLHVVGQGVALRPSVVRLPERRAAFVTSPLAASEVLQRQGQPLRVDDGDESSPGSRGRGLAPGFARPGQACPSTVAQRSTTADSQRYESLARSRDMTTKSGPVPWERRSFSKSVMEATMTARALGTVSFHLPVRCGGQRTSTRRRPGGGGCDEGLAGVHLPDDGGAAVGLEGEHSLGRPLWEQCWYPSQTPAAIRAQT